MTPCNTAEAAHYMCLPTSASTGNLGYCTVSHSFLRQYIDTKIFCFFGTNASLSKTRQVLHAYSYEGYLTLGKVPSHPRVQIHPAIDADATFEVSRNGVFLLQFGCAVVEIEAPMFASTRFLHVSGSRRKSASHPCT